jgi:hypothetical protein
MFGRGKKGAVQGSWTEMREVLFGDVPISGWLGTSKSPGEPWSSFREVQRSLDTGDQKSASEILLKILETPGLESRNYLQAWHILKSLGINPPIERNKELLGVVVEVGMPRGLDIIAAYADHSARYFNFSGKAVIWDRPDDRFDSAIDEIMRAGSATLAVIGPWDKARPAAPPKDQVRINLLTPTGLHFGQGPFEALMKDARGAPVLAAVTKLMHQLIRLAKEVS